MPEFEPHSRNEALLNAIANGQESTIVPQSRNEFLLSDISKKQVPEFTPHTRIEALLMEVARTVAEGGGGNPNRVETITGTLAQPFGELFEELTTALASKNATAELEFTFNGILQHLPLKGGETMISGGLATVQNGSYLSGEIKWFASGLNSALMVGTVTNNQIVDMKSTISRIASTLTIIWHPLPEG